jgi:hypothetical protein
MVLKILAIVGAVIVVVVGVGGYLVGSAAFATRGTQAQASASLETARTHTFTLESSLNVPNFDLTGASPDFAKAKKTADDYLTGTDQANATIRADQGALRTADERLRARAAGVFALPFRASLDNQRARVEAMLSALDAASAGLAIETSQMKLVSAAFDAFAEFGVLTARLQKQDINGSLGVFPTLDAKLQAAATLAQAPSVPPQIRTEMQDLQATSTDMRTYLQAIQRRDSRGALAAQTRLDADTKALDSLDQTGVDAYERTLLQPYRDRYDSGVRAAGFTIKSS